MFEEFKVFLEPFINCQQFENLSKLLLDITKEGLEGLVSSKGFEPISTFFIILIICRKCFFYTLRKRLDSLKGLKSSKGFGPLPWLLDRGSKPFKLLKLSKTSKPYRAI